MKTLRASGQPLPPRRIGASGSIRPVETSPLDEGIMVETARDRLNQSFPRVLDPKAVHSILFNAINGDPWDWERLWLAMLDSWPRLQKNLNELQREVTEALYRAIPYAEQDEEPTPEAKKVAQAAERMLWKCRPRPAYAEGRLEDLIGWLVAGYFTGISVSEIDWHKVGGYWVPRAYRQISAGHFGYSPQTEEADRLMMRREALMGDYQDFPEHRFVIGIHGGHPGNPTVSAPLRALTGYWLAAVFGLEWFMKFAQMFGQPMRWATYASDKDKDGVIEMMRKMGAGGWGVAPQGTEVEFMESGKSGSTIPQSDLLRLADEQCDIFMLGQTLTSSTPTKGGSRAQGEVHADTKKGIVRGLADYVGRAITDQVIPAWAFWNAGFIPDELPEWFAEWPEPIDEKANAETAKILAEMGLPLMRAELYKNVGYSIPEAGADVFVSSSGAAAPVVAAAETKDEPPAPKPGLLQLLERIPTADPAQIEETLLDAMIS